MRQLFDWAFAEAPAAALAALPIAIFWLTLVAWRMRARSRSAAIKTSTWDAGVLLSIEVILLFTIQPSLQIHPELSQWSLVPFADLIHSFPKPEWARELAVGELLGNIALFIPFGAALALRFRSMSIGRAVLFSALLSIGVEVSQALWPYRHRSDVTDVLMNSLGGLIGFIALRVLVSAWHGVHPAPARPASPPAAR